MKCLLTTAMWGDWHVGMFLAVNLPTLLAPDNLPQFVKTVQAEYVIYTTRHDAIRLRKNAAYRRLLQIMPVRLRFISSRQTADPISVHHALWNRSIRRARNNDAFIVLVPPDVLWSNGSFMHLANVLNAGKRAIFMTYLRVASETLVPALEASFPAETCPTIALSGHEMMQLSLRHLHPLMAAYIRSSPHFPVHPEMVMWPVFGEGFLLRVLARELFCFEPGRYALTGHALLRDMPNLDEVHIVTDSDQLLALSLTPLWKDLDWYMEPRRADPARIGRWWLTYDSPINRHIASQQFRFHIGKTGATWRRIEQQADGFVRHCLAAREILRVALSLPDVGCRKAGEFIADLVAAHRLSRDWRDRGPFLILAPTDSGVKEMSLHPIDRLDAMCLIRTHLVPLLSIESALTSEWLRVRTLTGLDVVIEGVPRSAYGIGCGEHIIIPIDRPISPSATGRRKVLTVHAVYEGIPRNALAQCGNNLEKHRSNGASKT